MNARTEHVQVPGATLWTSRQGEGPPLVLCHGGPGLWDYLGPVADMVGDLATVYRYDQRACGRSTGVPGYDIATAVSDLEALRTHWGIEQWAVGGHSWGADLALAYCLEHPGRVRALVYISNAGPGADPSWRAEYHANRDARLSLEERRRLEELEELRSRARGERWAELDREYCEIVWSVDFADRGRARELAQALFVEGIHPNYEVNRVLSVDGKRFFSDQAVGERLADVRVPTLIVHGEADPRPAWAARQLSELIPGARFVSLPSVSHVPWLERPGLLRGALRSFLAEDAVYQVRHREYHEAGSGALLVTATGCGGRPPMAGTSSSSPRFRFTKNDSGGQFRKGWRRA